MSQYLSQKDKYDIVEEIYKHGQAAEKQRFKEFVSATRMQRWWRGRIARIRLTNAVEAASTVSRFMGAVKAKKILMRCIKKRVLLDQREFFDQKIVKFQALWRGYASRKNKFSYYQWKRDLAKLEIINEITLRNLKQYKIMKQLEEAQQKNEKENKLEKNRPNYEPINYLTCTSTQIVDRSKVIHKKKRSEIIPSCMINVFEEKKPPVQLNPIKSRGRPKGPFRSEAAVNKQKMRAPSPTLRVATPYDFHKNKKQYENKLWWIRRIQDPMKFEKVSKPSYERTLWGLTKFYPGELTTFNLRDEYEDPNRPKFRSQVRSIPLFDQFGRTYNER
ncbi:Oidioi.mRNA.OKI2018_I69.chr1.g39.t1.cds [Oikopleura dioica]|uniref:Oidioi.mRNA.OKI2018_I69.chr1.g39.t1.cds n=1 Tax=Oikopleura dioica TaxID=34765 RepID=A0ABN7SJ31_OIKDI|nr:Oidioi.mRNA.OKI2018_I69.chr1.g39.t1.cds [Oikopleura dioica]